MTRHTIGEIKSTATLFFSNEYSYSLYEFNSITLAEYEIGLEKVIHRDSEPLNKVNYALCKSHCYLKRSACVAVSKISANALLAKALSVRKSQAGLLLVTIRAVRKEYI